MAEFKFEVGQKNIYWHPTFFTKFTKFWDKI